jgi:glycerol-3-phosphate acyltransferase PlsY
MSPKGRGENPPPGNPPTIRGTLLDLMARTARLLASATLGYAVGSVPVGLLIGRLTRGIDVREYGSHSTGMANVMRTAGLGAGALTLVLDVGKGAVAARLGQLVDGSPQGGVSAGLAAVIGHSWPVFAGFRGGKSSATTFGAALVVSPPSAAAAVSVGLAGLAVTRRTSVLSLAGSAAGLLTAIGLAASRRDGKALALLGPGVAIIVMRHRENISRLLRGTEPAVSVAEPPSPPRAA